MKIAFLTPTLGLGGYEKVIINYANELSKRGHEVFVLCGVASREEVNVFENTVKVIVFNSRQKYFAIHVSMFLAKHKDLDVIYSGFRYLNAVAVICKAITHHNVITFASQHGFEKKTIINNNYFIKKVLQKANIYVAVSEAVLKYEGAAINRNDIKVLYNPVIDVNKKHKIVTHKWFGHYPIIVSCGRLAKIKHQDLALKVLSSIRKHFDVKMIILGDGPEKDNYIGIAKSLGINESVDFLGNVKDPFPYMEQCIALLQLSEVEGFGNTIVEALFAQVPPIVTDCGGPTEIIEDGKYGIIVGKYSDLDIVDKCSEAIAKIIRKDCIFTDLKARSLDFTISNATNAFLQCINEWKDQCRSITNGGDYEQY